MNVCNLVVLIKKDYPQKRNKLKNSGLTILIKKSIILDKSEILRITISQKINCDQKRARLVEMTKLSHSKMDILLYDNFYVSKLFKFFSFI